jgi:hypothetical protein
MVLSWCCCCRLDVELARLEFEVHPYMALEQQLVGVTDTGNTP